MTGEQDSKANDDTLRQALAQSNSSPPAMPSSVIDAITSKANGAAGEWTNWSCPCAYGNPCHERCTCILPPSSSGCRRCCGYGSLEQRSAQAARLNALEQAAARVPVLEAALASDLMNIVDALPAQLDDNMVQRWRRVREIAERQWAALNPTAAGSESTRGGQE